MAIDNVRQRTLNIRSGGEKNKKIKRKECTISFIEKFESNMI